jgi:hypothetical protein
MGKTRDRSDTPTITSKTIIIPSPTATENITFFYTQDPITFLEIKSVVIGTTPSVTFSVKHGTDRSASGTEVVTSGLTCTNVTTGNTSTSFNSTTTAANSHVWITTSAATGTISELSVTIKYQAGG